VARDSIAAAETHDSGADLQARAADRFEWVAGIRDGTWQSVLLLFARIRVFAIRGSLSQVLALPD